MVSPLNTRKIWLEKIDIKLSPSFKDIESCEYNINTKITVKKRKDSLSFLITLDLVLKSQKKGGCRYDNIAIKTTGIFDLPEETPDELVNQLIPLNCLAILHGFSRGIVAQITGLNDGGPFLLPTVNFIEALKEAQDKT